MFYEIEDKCSGERRKGDQEDSAYKHPKRRSDLFLSKENMLKAKSLFKDLISNLYRLTVVILFGTWGGGLAGDRGHLLFLVFPLSFPTSSFFISRDLALLTLRREM